MKHVFIVNPKSGKANACTYLDPQLHIAAQAAKIEYQIVCTEYAGHATVLARQFAQEGEAVRLYACGGDGTLNEVFTGAYAYENAEVASIPCGSGNDFVRNFGTAEDFLNVADNIAGTALPIDLMSVNGGVSAAISSVGLDADVAYAIPNFRRIPLCGGSMAYNLAIVKCLLGRLGRNMVVELDGQVFEDHYTIVAVCNGSSYGGGFRAAPTADLQDGLLEVVMVKKLSRLRIAGVLALYKAGRHIENREVVEQLQDVLQYRNAKKIAIYPKDEKKFILNVDGECSPVGTLHAEVMPGAAKFVLPQSLYEKQRQSVMAE